ncbi:hypothetical protein GJ496_007491 [Pomphorhynchus laevis]|nr:hypothetical protein GJ496_007491 [Pomphorhynchus laevis]
MDINENLAASNIIVPASLSSSPVATSGTTIPPSRQRYATTLRDGSWYQSIKTHVPIALREQDRGKPPAMTLDANIFSVKKTCSTKKCFKRRFKASVLSFSTFTWCYISYANYNHRDSINVHRTN